MASTSNQTDYSDPRWDYDVFLSFRGPDVRNSFTSHLYAALTGSGIRTFIDDEELRAGKEIKPDLRKAIQGSRMSVIVFSENYASSRWCLDELVEILECKRSKGQIVLPIFYDVEPLVVRHQTGSYKKAFEKHNTRHELDIQKVKKWRDALTEAANISGRDLKNEENGNEARFIDKIVRNVQLEVRCLNGAKSLIGERVDSNVNNIKELLSIGSADVRIIGIYGMGGIGKTAVSKAVYDNYKHLNCFEGCAFVESIKDVSKLPDGLLRLQKKLLHQLQNTQNTNLKLSNRYEGINWIKKICGSRRVLILLDDLDDINQVNQLAGQKSWFSIGSRVIMVTGDEKLLKEAQVEHRYEMKVLDEDESLKLFRRHAIVEETPSEDLKSLSIDIARYCGGLPLALQVIGSHLLRENLTYWKNALEEFQSKPLKRIQDRLRISYDALSEDRKKIFLDVACFFIGWKAEYIIKFWDGCGFFAENSIRDLSDKCLLKIDENNCLWMHDLFRDMGRQIVRDMGSRLWMHDKVLDVLRSQIKGAEAVEGISLDLSNLQSIALETKAFEAMHQLRFLLINNVEVTGSFEHIFGKLRWLSWQYCPLESLPSNFHPGELIVLDLKYSKISKLWEGEKHLDNLKILDLSYCEFLVETPNFTHVQSLEHLMLSGCKRLSTIEFLESLLDLDLSCCENLTNLPTSICNLRPLQKLNLHGCSKLEQLPGELGNLECLLDLDLSCCENLTNLPTSICNLRPLQKLNLHGCSKLEQLPGELGNLECLLDLDLSCCENLTNLPTSICNLRPLQKLNLHGCSKLEQLPGELGNLECLLDLDLSCCENLTNLPTSICNLRPLQKLNLNGCSKLEQLPGELGNLECLLELDLSCCENLTNLPTSICNLRPLQKLNLHGCSKLEQLPGELGNLECLLDLDMSCCENITNLPTSICNLRPLQKLNLHGCSKLEQLPGELGNLECLLDLDLSCCENLTNVPTSICNLRPLQKLNLNGCSKLEQLPGELGNLECLLELDLSCCENLTNLPTSICNLRPLQKLNLHGCSKLEQLPGELGNLECLLDLDMSCCKNLTNLPTSICNLRPLQKLNLHGCSKLEQLPGELGNLECLLDLDMSCCENITNLPTSICNLRPLQKLNLHGCSKLEQLPGELGNLECLLDLDLSCCENLTNLPTSICNLRPLQKLNLNGCSKLEQLPGELGNLEIWNACWNWI